MTRYANKYSIRSCVFLLAVIAVCLTPALLHAGQYVVITLNNGEQYEGEIFQENEQEIVLECPQIGFKILKRAQIREIKQTPRPGQKPAPNEEKPSDSTREKTSPDNLLPEVNPDPHKKFTALLAKLKGEKPISLKEFADELTKLGHSVVPSLLRYLCDERLDDEMFYLLTDVIIKVLGDTAVSYTCQFLDCESGTVRLTIIRILERIGNKEALTALLRPLSGSRTRMIEAAEKAIVAVLKRQPDNQELFNMLGEAAISTKDISKKVRIISCLGFSGSRLAVPVLLGFTADWEIRIRKAAITTLVILGFDDTAVLTAIRRFLQDKDFQLRREAALSLGKLQDIESVENLIALLNDEKKGVRGSAHYSLRQMTGQNFPPNSERWKVWWDNESKKHNEHRDALLKQLRQGNKKEMLDAMHGLTGIRLGKKRIVAALLEFLSHGDPVVRVEACKALAAMKARKAVPELIERLDDPDESLKKAVHEALFSITGEKLPPDKKAWQDWSSSVGM